MIDGSLSIFIHADSTLCPDSVLEEGKYEFDYNKNRVIGSEEGGSSTFQS